MDGPPVAWWIQYKGVVVRLGLADLGVYLVVMATIRIVLLRRLQRHQLAAAAAALQAQLADARLQALRLQLNPHFLFNALNGLAMLIRAGSSKRALQMLVTLSELLRLVLATDADTVPLATELAFIERYLSLEEVRLHEGLRVSVRASPDALSAAIPPFLVNLHCVREIVTSDDGRPALTLFNGSRVVISRERREAIEQALRRVPRGGGAWLRVNM